MSVKSETPNVGERVLAGSLWISAWRWSARLIGLATTIVVARILLPADFGVFATGLIVIFLFDNLLDVGTDLYLIRLPDPEREDYDTAWTLRLMLTACSAAIVFLGAPAASHFFDDSRLADVFRVLALASLIRGFVNVGLTIYRRELRYFEISRIGITQRVVGSAATVVFAIALENFWALVFGEIVLRLAELTLSYTAHPFRPRFSLSRIAKQWHFSRWLMLRNLATFFHGRADQIIIAKFFGIEAIGIYAMAMRFAMIPTGQLTAPLRNPTYAGLAKKQNDAQQLGRSVVQLIGATSVVVMPAAVLFIAIGQQVLTLILGTNWAATGPLIAPLVLSAMFAVLAEPAGAVLTLKGRVRLIAVISWCAAAVMVGALTAVALFGTLGALAWTRAALSGVLLVVYLAVTVTVAEIAWRRVLGAIYRPATAAAVAGTVAQALAGFDAVSVLEIGLAVLAAGTSYAIILYSLWRIAAPAESGEALIMRSGANLLRRRNRRSAR